MSTDEPAPPSPHPPAGWYPDPADGTLVRFWDGQAWAQHRRPRDATPARRPLALVDLDAEMEAVMPQALRQPVSERTGFMAGHMLRILSERVNEIVERVNDLSAGPRGGG